VQTVHTLTMISAAIHSVSFSSDMTFNQVILPTTAEVVLVHRDNVNVVRSDRSQLPKTLNEFYLPAVLGGEHLTGTVYFRWNERFQFWHVVTDSKVQTAEAVEDKLCVPSWRILVYVQRRELAEFVCLFVCCLTAHQHYLSH